MSVNKLFLFFIIIILVLNSCSLFDDDKGPDTQGAQSQAEEALNDLISLLNNENFNPDDYETELAAIEENFRSSLNKDSNNYIANTGMAIFSIFNLKYNEEADKIRYLADYDAIPPEGTTASEIQNCILEDIIPALEKSKEYIEKAVNNIYSNSILINMENDEREFDKADLLLFKAAIEIVLIAPYTATILDFRLIDPDTSKEFIITENEERSMDYIFDYNLDNSSSNFLKYLKGENLRKIHTNLNSALTSLNAAYTSMLMEYDDQGDDMIPKDNIIIPKEDATEINNFLADYNINANIRTIPDILELIEDYLNRTSVTIPFTRRYEYTGAPGIIYKETKNYKITTHNFFGIYESGNYPEALRGFINNYESLDLSLNNTFLTETNTPITKDDADFMAKAFYTSLFEPETVDP